jgi:hypothetical protein
MAKAGDTEMGCNDTAITIDGTPEQVRGSIKPRQTEPHLTTPHQSPINPTNQPTTPRRSTAARC